MFGRDKGAKLQVDTLLGPGTVIEGNLAFVGGLHLEGRVTGSVACAQGEAGSILSVSEQGSIAGSVSAPNVILNGEVQGDIVAPGRVVLGAAARVAGNVHYGQIEMALGALIKGRLVPLNSRGAATISRAKEGAVSGHLAFDAAAPAP